MALESEDKRDPKRAHVVLSKGHKCSGGATQG
jgi:transketolase N-terminal domain/subunit